MKQGFLLTVIFSMAVLLLGCSTIQGFEQGYVQAREHPIRTMTVEELTEARRSVGLRDSDYYKEKRILDAINNN